MGNTAKRSSAPAAQAAETPRAAGGATATAQSGSVVSAPQISDIHAQGDTQINYTVNNTYVQPAAGTEDTTAVSPQPEGKIQRCQADLKSYLVNTTRNLSQGTREDGSTPLNKIYTELYITEGGSGEVNSEHEVIKLECRRRSSEEKKIHLNDIFQRLPNEETSPQRVLTKGIAGIGKTVAVQKFTQDWAGGRANPDTHFIFPFTFRELNLIKDQTFSLVTLISYYFEEVTDLETSDYSDSEVLFIFDGLDESKFPLDFERNEMCRSVTKATSVDALLTNLIAGKLLHKASVWITSRPAAATKVPSEFIDRVTEVRGFSDEQKVEYFQKKVSDKDVAQMVLDHLQSKQLRSLYIMCHIPVFCWISATVLQTFLAETGGGELPKSVTEMYTHFLIIQTKLKHQKDYQEGETDKDVVMKLGKLAFEQLQRGNVIFYQNDLKSCNIDLKQAAVYSGVCTEIIRKECGLHKQEIYSFIHLSVQEFLAALYVLETFIGSGLNLIPSQTGVTVGSKNGELPIILLHKNAVDMALASDYGQWDLFLRFLLGLSQDKNQELLQKSFGFRERRPQSNQETITYIQEKIRKLSNTDKTINLFHCLNELGDQSLVEQVQQYHRSGDVGKISSPAHWSALAYLLLVSNEDLDVFDLRKYHRSDDVLERLLPVFKASKKALLSDCNLTARSCKYISSVVGLESSGLEELDLSRNELKDDGAALLSHGLRNPNCKLQSIILEECSVTKKGCQSLVSGLASNPSHLKLLDLSKNSFHDEGLELLSEVLSRCSLETLRLSECGITGKPLASALSFNPSHLKNLDLSRNRCGGPAAAQLCDFLRHPQCRLERLCLFNSKLQQECAAALASALASNPSHMRELDLGGNNLGDDGVMGIAGLLKDPNCKVTTLRLAGCRFTERGCAALASGLRSNPAHLRVLDLARNDLRDSGAENLSEFFAEPLCQLETLILKCCSLTAACCRSLIRALGGSSALKELDLSYNSLREQGVEPLSDWLGRPECRLEILRLSKCTDGSCESLASALRLNPSHLRDLELRETDPAGSGVKLLSDLQEDSCYRLQTLTVTE